MLVVEDNPDVAGVMVSMLEQLGYQVQEVRDPGAALEATERQSFDLVVSDIVMAGSMDGFELARALRERKPDLPVLLVTGYSRMPGGASEEFVAVTGTPKPRSKTTASAT